MSLQRKRVCSPSNDGHTASKKVRNTTINSTQFSQELEEAIVHRSGKILRMRLTNFMCHANMIFEFNQRMNFLVGSNGSGKSAVMAALALGLGCKASATNRCSSFKNFIKSGANYAEVEIVICNSGLDAYEPETYGKTITVVRNLKASGGSAYKIMNESGGIVSRKMHELHRITNYLNIQADNPIFVLSQDNARSFLRNMNDHKNYDLYMKATQIEAILENVNECLADYQNLKFSWSCKKKELNNLKNDVEELQRKYLKLQSVESIKTQLSDINVEKMWSCVFAQESVLEDIRQRAEVLLDKVSELKEEVNNKDTTEESIRRTIKETEDDLKRVQQSIQDENREFQNIKATYNKIEDSCQQEARKLEKFKSRQRVIAEDIGQLERNIAERTELLTGATQSKREENERRLHDLELHKVELDAMISSSRQEIQMLTNTRINKEQVFEDLKRKRQELTESARLLQSRISSIKANSKEKLGIYGQEVTRFVAALERAHKEGRFTEMPRGPLGQYVNVPKEKYRAIIEHNLRGLLTSFLVDNGKDRAVFDSILKRECPNYKPTVITTKFYYQIYDVSGGMVHPVSGTSLLMNEIKCSDNVVFNCLIDRAGIEMILLTENKSVAENITSKANYVPQNLKKVLLVDPAIEFMPEPNYRMYSLNLKPARYIQVNMEERIRQMEDEHRDQERQIAGFYSKLTEMKDELKNIYQEKDKKARVVEKHEMNVRDIAEKIDEIKNVEYPTNKEVEILSKELEQLQLKSQSIAEELDKSKAEHRKLSTNKADYEFKLQKKKKNLADFENHIGVLREQVDKAKIKLNNLLSSSRHNEIKLKAVEKEYNDAKIEEERERHKLDTLTNTAEAESDRPEDARSEKALTQLSGKLEKQIQIATASNENVDEIKEKLDSKSNQYNADKLFVDHIATSMKNMKDSMDRRFRNINLLKNHTTVYMKFNFVNCLQRRNFTGDLYIDHEKRTLHISVIPRDKNVNGAVSSTKSLSGGERSYSTLAFLVSLWSCVDHPFYFLDEYDVFTDEVNREVMTRLLIQEGTKYAHRQYTFLTPQEMSMKASELITIHKLSKR